MFAVCFCRNAIVGLSVFLSVDSFGSLQIGSAVSFSLDTPGAQKDLHVAFFYHVTTWWDYIPHFDWLQKWTSQ